MAANEAEGDSTDGAAGPSVRDISQSVFKAAAKASRASVALPNGGDFDYACSYEAFPRRMAAAAGRLLRLSARVADRHTEWTGASRMPRLTVGMDPEDGYEGVLDVVDSMLERADLAIDEARGRSGIQKAMGGESTNALATHASPSGLPAGRGADVPRPQDSFTKGVVDNSNSPFVPFPYRRKRRKQKIDGDDNGNGGDGEGGDVATVNATTLSMPRLDEDGSYPHPFREELLAFGRRPADATPRQERIFAPMPDTPLTVVSSVGDLRALAERLLSESEIAVDLEHHDYRTFQGLTCLMQLSTRSHDYIIDTLSLWEEMPCLAGVFADPSVTKVMHGADKDVEWLQRDFGIYVVNLFDTGQAARLLDFPSFGLKYLLSHFCDVQVDKRHQLADWRVRPLPPALIDYARSDTHYLLYIHDRLHNMLATAESRRDLVQLHRSNSTKVSLIKYEKDIWTPTAYLSTYQKQSCNFGDESLAAFAALYKWRHTTAREHDESLRYVLPNHAMVNIAAECPVEPIHLVALCRPAPPLLRKGAKAVCDIIRRAKADPKPWLARQPFTGEAVPAADPRPDLAALLSPDRLKPTGGTAAASMSPGAKLSGSVEEGAGAGGPATPAQRDKRIEELLSTPLIYQKRKAQFNPAQSCSGGRTGGAGGAGRAGHAGPLSALFNALAATVTGPEDVEGSAEARDAKLKAAELHAATLNFASLRQILAALAGDDGDGQPNIRGGNRNNMEARASDVDGSEDVTHVGPEGGVTDEAVSGVQAGADVVGKVIDLTASSGDAGCVEGVEAPSRSEADAATVNDAGEGTGDGLIVVSEVDGGAGGKRGKRRRRSRKGKKSSAVPAPESSSAPAPDKAGRHKFDFSPNVELPEFTTEDYQPSSPGGAVGDNDGNGDAGDGSSDLPPAKKPRPSNAPNLHVPVSRGPRVQRQTFKR